MLTPLPEHSAPFPPLGHAALRMSVHCPAMHTYDNNINGIPYTKQPTKCETVEIYLVDTTFCSILHNPYVIFEATIQFINKGSALLFHQQKGRKRAVYMTYVMIQRDILALMRSTHVSDTQCIVNSWVKRASMGTLQGTTQNIPEGNKHVKYLI